MPDILSTILSLPLGIVPVSGQTGSLNKERSQEQLNGVPAAGRSGVPESLVLVASSGAENTPLRAQTWGLILYRNPQTLEHLRDLLMDRCHAALATVVLQPRNIRQRLEFKPAGPRSICAGRPVLAD